MPPPMVPAPTTAARAMAFTGVSRGTSGILATSRSAKNTWTRARDSVDTTHAAKRSRSTREPVSKSVVTAASMASIAATGARRPRASLAAAARAAAQAAMPSAREVFTGSSRVRRGPPAAARARAKATAPSSSGPSITASMSPAASARAAPIGLPAVHNSSAVATSHNRGRRCVPPAPGMMPRVTSGWPSFAPAAATR